MSQQRSEALDNLRQNPNYDVLVMGAGINGAVAAAALSAKGLRVALVDQGDFAGQTSQHSSNLVWGGIKYLESYEFGLVRKLCNSRNHLMRQYPNQIREIRFLVTLEKGFRRPPWMLWAGAWMYWAFGQGFTQTPRLVSKKQIHQYEPVIDLKKAKGGLVYSDAYLIDNDARFVFQFVRRAMDHGATAVNYLKVNQLTRQDGQWHVQLQDQGPSDSGDYTLNAKAIINACGPWVDQLNQANQQQTQHHHLLSKGVHLIVDRVTPHKRVLSFFADDGRLFFVIPMGHRTCIGTTDTRVEQPAVEPTEEDCRFILDNINKRLDLSQPLTMADVIAHRCGVRPLAVQGSSQSDDWMHLSRKHAVDVDAKQRYVSVFGGKLTDCLNVGEELAAEMQKLGLTLNKPNAVWYGEAGRSDWQTFCTAADELPELSTDARQRLWRRYGMEAHQALDAIKADTSLMEPIIDGAPCMLAEMTMLKNREMITRLEDLLRRRTMLALTERREQLKESVNLRRACVMLFGDQAEQRWQEYFDQES